MDRPCAVSGFPLSPPKKKEENRRKLKKEEGKKEREEGEQEQEENQSISQQPTGHPGSAACAQPLAVPASA